MRITFTAQNVTANIVDNDGNEILTYSSENYRFTTDVTGLAGAFHLLVAQANRLSHEQRMLREANFKEFTTKYKAA